MRRFIRSWSRKQLNTIREPFQPQLDWFLPLAANQITVTNSRGGFLSLLSCCRRNHLRKHFTAFHSHNNFLLLMSFINPTVTKFLNEPSIEMLKRNGKTRGGEDCNLFPLDVKECLRVGYKIQIAHLAARKVLFQPSLLGISSFRIVGWRLSWPSELLFLCAERD